MKLIELLTENRANLFHGTNSENAARILTSNIIQPSTSHTAGLQTNAHATYKGRSFRPRNVNKFGKVEGVSLTRSKRFAQEWLNGEGVVFELDGNALSQRYRMVPIDYYGNRREAEEFVVGPIRHINNYLVAIHVSPETLEWLNDQNEIYPNAGYDVFTNHPKLKST